MEMNMVLKEVMYEEPKIGISLCSFEEVEVIGERVILMDGLLYSQYLYYIVNYKSENGQPFVALNSNIRIRSNNVA